MRTGRRLVRAGLAGAMIALVAMVSPHDAQGVVVICKRGKRIKLRETACRKKETQIDATELGVTGPQGTQGPPGPAGPGALWALVAPDGSIGAQSGGVSVVYGGSGSGMAGIYIVDFGASLADRVVQMTSAATMSDASSRGVVAVAKCSGPDSATTCGTLAPGGDDEQRAIVLTFATDNGTLEDHAFFVTAF